jgi:hypothetical protein
VAQPPCVLSGADCEDDGCAPSLSASASPAGPDGPLQTLSHHATSCVSQGIGELASDLGAAPAGATTKTRMQIHRVKA